LSYFRTRFTSFEEFQREGLLGGESLGKEELELLRDLEDDDEFDRPPRRRGRSDLQFSSRGMD
jgi:hypothetical protein